MSTVFEKAQGLGVAEGPQMSPPNTPPSSNVSHAERIMSLTNRVCELEAGLHEAASRILALEKRLGD